MSRSALLITHQIDELQSIGRFLEHCGWEVFRATSGEQGLELQAAHRPDVVVLDLDLPGLYGLQLLELLISRDATTILLSERANVTTAVEAMRMGAENFLQKPFELEHLGASLDRAHEKVELRRANELLARRLAEGRQGPRLGSSSQMQALWRTVELLAEADATTVLLSGEPGVGKGWIAQSVHAHSRRRHAPLVQASGAGLNPLLLESELFGHERGALALAPNGRRGLFELADGGTLILEDIEALPPELQAKLLRVLESRSYRRMGGTRELTADVRVVATTTRDLPALVEAGRFREDLCCTLSVLPLRIPALRERTPEDVLELVASLQAELGAPRRPLEIAPRAMACLLAYAWPGNVRELRRALERARVLRGGTGRIEPEHLPAEVGRAGADGGSSGAPRELFQLRTLEDVERQYIEGALLRLDGNRTRVAETLGISRATLHNKIRRYGLNELGRN
jgi:DNA-binding NtrC family response regulator